MGGGIGMGNTCKPMAVSFQCMTKPTTIKKKKKICFHDPRNKSIILPWNSDFKMYKKLKINLAYRKFNKVLKKRY